MIRNAAMFGLAAAISTAALADGVGSVPQAEPTITDSTFKWSLSEDFSYINFKDADDLMVFDTNFSLPLEGGHLNLSLPTYSQDGDINIGDLSVGYDVLAFKGSNSVLGDYHVDLGGGVYLPVGDEQYQSGTIDPFFNAAIGFGVFGLDFVQTAEYRFVGGSAFSPWVGQQVDSDTLTLGSTLGRKFDALTLGVDFNQVFFIDGENYLAFVGPVAAVSLGSNVTVDLGAHFQVVKDDAFAETDYIVSAGLKIEF